MDPQVSQQLTQLLQQMLQVVQASGQGDAATGMDDEDDVDPSMLGNDGMGDDDLPDDDDMGADGMGGTLHHRVSKLEQHTGLKKSAFNLPLLERIDALETHWLGEEFEGPAIARVEQLEEAAGLQKSAEKPAAKKQAKAKPETEAEEDEAPDVIPLDALIKSAVQAGIKEGLRQMQSQQPAETEDLPSPNQMRKNARQQQIQYNQRRSQPHAVQTDAALAKAAQEWGYDEADLDQPVTLGDVLLAQYHAGKNGAGSLFADDDD